MKIVSIRVNTRGIGRIEREWRSVASCYDKFEIVSTGNIVSVDDIIPFAFSILSCRASRLLRKFADWYRDDLNRNSIGSERWLFQTTMRIIIRRVTTRSEFLRDEINNFSAYI